MRLRYCLSLAALLLPLGGGAVSAQQSTTEAVKGHDNGTDRGHLEATYHGGLVTPPLPKPKFTLTDTTGAPFDFWSRTDGYVTLLFFGYTECADVCPMQMANISAALRKLPRAVVAQYRVVFVSTDPDHDSPKSLRSWLDHFDQSIVGLTGSKAAIDSAQLAAKIPPSNGRADHAAFVLAWRFRVASW